MASSTASLALVSSCSDWTTSLRPAARGALLQPRLLSLRGCRSKEALDRRRGGERRGAEALHTEAWRRG